MIVEQTLRYPPTMTPASALSGKDSTARTQRLALWAAAATGVQVGAATVGSRYAVAELAPLTLAFLRYAIAVVFLLPFVVAGWSWRGLLDIVSERARVLDWLAMGALGLGQFGILIALLNYGLQHVTAARAALIFSLFPLLTLLLSGAMGRERITPSLVLGVLLSIAGVALSLMSRLQGSAAAEGWLGELAVLGAAAIGALCSVLYRPYLRRYPTIQVSVFAMAASVLFLGVAALSEHWPERLASISATAWAAVGFVGFSSAVGYVWWLYALKHLPPTRVTIFLALNPVTAALLGHWLLGERLDLWTVAAIGAIGVGLWLGTRAPAAP